MELKNLMNFIEENKDEYLELELTTTCNECKGFGYFSEDGINLEPCENCCAEGTITQN